MPAGHEVAPLQTPFVQVSFVHPPPHDPHAKRLEVRSRHAPVQLGSGNAHDALQTPSSQTWPAPQTVPHAPQLDGLPMSDSQPFVGSPSQSSRSVRHVATFNAPATHAKLATVDETTEGLAHPVCVQPYEGSSTETQTSSQRFVPAAHPAVQTSGEPPSEPAPVPASLAASAPASRRAASAVVLASPTTDGVEASVGADASVPLEPLDDVVPPPSVPGSSGAESELGEQAAARVNPARSHPRMRRMVFPSLHTAALTFSRAHRPWW